MADIEKAARFRRRFTAWRGETLATREEPFIASAIAISNFVDETNLATIQLGLETGSPIYEGFEKRTYGALLYGKLTLEDYHQQCTANASFADGEQEIVAAMLVRLHSLYETPFNDPSTKYRELMIHVNNWLDNCILNNTNPVLAKTTLLALYTMLKFMDTKLGKLNFTEKGIFSLTSLDRIRTKEQIQVLLNKVATQMGELELIINPPPVVDNEDDEPHLERPTSLEEYFDRQFLDIIIQERGSLPEKMALISTRLNHLRQEITTLLAEKARGAAIQAHINHALAIVNAIDTNEHKVFKKQYALALINQHRASFDDLLAHSTVEERAAWTTRLAQLEMPDLSRRAIDTAQYVLSWATFLPTAAYRALASKSVKKTMDSYFSLSTFDGETKVKLWTLAVARLATLREELAASNATKEQIVTLLVDNNPAAKSLFLAATTHRLEEVIATHRRIQQVVVDFAALSELITNNQERLQTVRGLNHHIDAFIEQHDGFFVQLSLLLSKVWNIFKTDKAAKVEEVQTIKNSLIQLKAEYEHTIAEGMEAITSNETISTHLKDAFVAQLVRPNDNEEALASPASEVRQPSRNIITAHHLVTTMFNQLRTPAAPAELAEEDEEATNPHRL